MAEKQKIPEQAETEIHRDNLLLKILTKPTDTLVYILNNSPQKL